MTDHPPPTDVALVNDNGHAAWEPPDIATTATVPTDPPLVGVVNGAVPATSRRFHVVLDEHAVVQLDDIVAVTQHLPDGRSVTHYGIVVEASRHIEGATYASDTARITRDATMPGQTARQVEVQVLRTVPEMWLAPEPGEPVTRATGEDRDRALFLDQMSAPLPVGLDQSGQPIHVDFAFLSGEKGGHVNIAGVSGVATKTSYATFLLYMLTQTPQGRALLGAHAANTRAVVFNVKGEDLLHLDRPNAAFADKEGAGDGWRRLGVDTPGAFESVSIWCPRAAGRREALAPDVHSRLTSEVRIYGWTPREFISRGLLQFCFTEDDDTRTQVGFVEQRVRLQLARHAYPLAGEEGAVVLATPPATSTHTFERVISETREPLNAVDGVAIRDFSDLVNFLTTRIEQEDAAWTANVAPGTGQAFLRRLYALIPRMGHLVSTGVDVVDLDAANVAVVDIHNLHDAAQRFVVGALLHGIFEAKQGSGREPLRFVVLDELNKYAPREGRSPLKELLIDIAERGRSLGVLLVGAQQAANAVAPAIIRNAAIKVVGRLDAGEAAEYRFLTPELRERAARFLPGTMVLDQPLIPAPIPLRFPFPAYATNVIEGRSSRTETTTAANAVFDRL